MRLSIPGAMNDKFAARYVCQNDWVGSTLCDDGYPLNDPRFLCSDDTDEHKEARFVIEQAFANIKIRWKMVGSRFCRNRRWHSLAISAAFILNNMCKVFESE